jgi:hypothetical protein
MAVAGHPALMAAYRCACGYRWYLCADGLPGWDWPAYGHTGMLPAAELKRRARLVQQAIVMARGVDQGRYLMHQNAAHHHRELALDRTGQAPALGRLATMRPASMSAAHKAALRTREMDDIWRVGF